MSNCSCSKDQTPREVFEYLKQANAMSTQHKEGAKGLGLFLVPDPEAGVLEEKVVTVDGLSYDECAKRGENCLAYKWIPAGFKSAADVQAERARSCGQWCGTNRDWCPGLCFCGRGNYCR